MKGRLREGRGRKFVHINGFFSHLVNEQVSCFTGSTDGEDFRVVFEDIEVPSALVHPGVLSLSLSFSLSFSLSLSLWLS